MSHVLLRKESDVHPWPRCTSHLITVALSSHCNQGGAGVDFRKTNKNGMFTIFKVRSASKKKIRPDQTKPKVDFPSKQD